MAKTRAQRKAERRAREAQQRQGGPSESKAQHDTQVGRSGEVAEAEAVEAGMGAGASEQQLETPGAPKPSRTERRAAERERKEADKRQRAEQKRREAEQLAKRQRQAQADRQRGGVLGFFASCWAELKKVQWPDRETLVQATAVTIIFVAIVGAYLGALDAMFNFLVKRIL